MTRGHNRKALSRSRSIEAVATDRRSSLGLWSRHSFCCQTLLFHVVSLRSPRSSFGLALALLAASIVTAPLALAAPTAPFCAEGQAPHFAFGFADLKVAVGAPMGDPVECEHPNSENGDTLQQTTTGLAMYRQSTNTSEFTDGWNHWALTRGGLVAWSGSDAPAPSAEPPTTAPSAQQPAAPAGLQCIDLGGGACLNSAADLADTVSLLAHTSAAAPLLRTAARAGYSLKFGDLPLDVLGLFRPSRKDVTVSSFLQAYPTIDRAPVIAHELQHVSDWIGHGALLDTTPGCLATETNAFTTESATWLELGGGHLKPPTNDLEREFNMISQAISTDPGGFASRLTVVYHDQCAAG